MPPLLLLLLGGLAIVVALRAPLRPATIVLLLGVVVVPTALPLPVGPRWLALSRLILWAYVVGLAIRVRREEVPVGALRPTRVHAAFVAFLVVGFVCGFSLMPAGTPRFESLLIWFTLVDQLAVLVAVLCAARMLGVWWVARAVGVLGAGLALIALGERHLGMNWNHFFFQGTVGEFAAGSADLGERGDAIRVRGPSQFALEFGWVCAALVPFVAVVVSRARGLAVRAVPALLALAVVWTVSRSAIVGVVVGAALLILGSRGDRRVAALVLVGAAVAALVYVQAPSIQEPFDRASPDSAESRVRRWVMVTTAVEDRPLVGLGFAGPRVRGVYGVDTSYVLFYATIGVIGLTAFVVLIVTTLLSVARGLRGPPAPERTLAAGVLSSLVVAVIGTAFFDSFQVAGASRLFWVLAAVGLALAERTAISSASSYRRVRATDVAVRATLPLLGLAAGLVLTSVAPTHAAHRAVFDVMGAEARVRVDQDPEFIGRVLITTVCDLVAPYDAPGVGVECWEPRQSSTIGELRIEGSEPADVRHAADDITARIEYALPGARVRPVAQLEEGTPTWASTAPVWGALTGLGAAALLPRRRRGHRDRQLAPAP